MVEDSRTKPGTNEYPSVQKDFTTASMDAQPTAASMAGLEPCIIHISVLKAPV